MAMRSIRLCGTRRCGLVVSRRWFRLPEASKAIQETAQREEIPVGAYGIINSERNTFVDGHLRPYISNMVTPADFRRNVRDSFNMHHKRRRLKSSSQGRAQGLFCILLHALHYCCLPRDRLVGTTKYMKDAIRREVVFNSKSGVQWDEMVEEVSVRDPALKSNTLKLISLYQYGDSEIPLPSLRDSDWQSVQLALAAVLYHAPELSYEVIVKSISSMLSSKITNAYNTINGLPRVPTFIMRDILERIPKSDLETDLLLELYPLLKGSDSSFQTLRNLVHFTKIYHVSRLEQLVRNIVNQEKLSDYEWNTLVFDIGDTAHNIQSKEFSFALLRSQRVILEHIRVHDGNVTAPGYLGMALSLSGVSSTRSKQFYNSSMGHIRTDEEREQFKRVTLKLSESPNELVENFNQTILDSKDDLTLWDEFLQASFERDVNIQYDNELLESHLASPKIKSKSTILSKMSAEEIFAKSSELDNKSLSILFKKLYQHEEPISIFPSGHDCARYLFQSLANPSRQIVGQVLYGESKLDPEGALDRYRSMLSKYCDGFPNEKCLLSLMVPSLALPGLKWARIASSRTAVYEFRKFVHPTQDCASLIPSTNLWKTYILLCGRYGYHEELSEVFEIWETLRYVPDRQTLSMFLGAFPNHMGERIRDHGVEHLSPNDYDEISRDVWDWPSTKEIAFWRDRMNK